MTPARIKCELDERKITQRAIAKELGRSAFHIHAVIYRMRISDPVMKAIAAKIGEDHRRVFPEYYLRSKKKKREGRRTPQKTKSLM
jgi:hypothetical protein